MEVQKVKDEKTAKRLEYLMIQLGYNQTEFAKILQMDNSNLARKLKATAPLTRRDLARLEMKNVNVNWLLTGEGNMLNGKFDDGSNKDADLDCKPRIQNYAMAGSLSEALESSSTTEPVIKQFPDYDCTIIVEGNSMEPTYQKGDELAIKKETTAECRWGSPHVLNTRRGIVVKRIYPDEDGKGFRCESDNKEYKPYILPETDVFSIYKIIGLLRLQSE